MNNNLPPDMAKAPAAELQAGEQVMWAERKSPSWDRDKLILLVLAGIFLLVSCVLLYYKPCMAHAAWLLLPAVPLVLLRYLWLRDAGIYYTLTNKRAIITEAPLWGSRHTTIAVPLQPRLISNCKHRHGCADYYFISYTGGVFTKDGFLNIRSTTQLEEQLSRLGLSLPAPQENRPLTECPRPTPHLSRLQYIINYLLCCDIAQELIDSATGQYIAQGCLTLLLVLLIWRTIPVERRMSKESHHLFTPKES